MFIGNSVTRQLKTWAKQGKSWAAGEEVIPTIISLYFHPPCAKGPILFHFSLFSGASGRSVNAGRSRKVPLPVRLRPKFFTF